MRGAQVMAENLSETSVVQWGGKLEQSKNFKKCFIGIGHGELGSKQL